MENTANKNIYCIKETDYNDYLSLHSDFIEVEVLNIAHICSISYIQKEWRNLGSGENPFKYFVRVECVNSSYLMLLKSSHQEVLNDFINQICINIHSIKF